MDYNIFSKKPIGNKARNLFWLKNNFGHVPFFYLINPKKNVSSYDLLQKKIGEVLYEMWSGGLPTESGIKKISQLIDSAEIKNEENRLSVEKKFIFRTSAGLEDASDASFAGMYLSHGPVPAEEFDLSTIIKQCWKSLYTPKVLAYLKAKDVIWQAQNFSIIIQEFYFSDFSGVAFTDLAEKTITLSYARGGAKKIVEGENSKLIKLSIENYSQEQVFLTFEERIKMSTLIEFLNTLWKISLAKNKGQDIEWALNPSDFAIWQTRDITADLSDLEIIYDNTNISESYPGITLPLTYSFIKFAYTQVYKNFLTFIGVKKELLRSFKEESGNLLGQMKGRVYYNVKNWYKMIRLLPGYSQNKDFFESMWNPKEKIVEKKKQGSFLKIIFILPLFLSFSLKIIFAKKYIEKFVSRFNRQHDYYHQVNLAEKNPAELADHYLEIENVFFSAWSVPILNDFRVMVFQGILRKIIKKTGGKNIDYLISCLITHDKDLFSLKPLNKLQEISELVKNDDLIRKLFQFNDSKVIYEKIINNPGGKYQKVKDEILDYLKDFGDRNPSELKLESLTVRNHPEIIIAILRGYLDKQNLGLNLKDKSEQEQIIIELKTEFKKRYPFFHSVLWLIFKKVLVETRRSVADRERMRLLRSRAYNLAREVFLQFGRILLAKGEINEIENVFYLTRQEILSSARNDKINKEFGKLVEERKKVFEQYRNEPTPPRRFNLQEFLRSPSNFNDTALDGQKILRGIAASPGRVRGEAICLKEFNPLANLNNKILITAQTDPGWTIVFPLISGLVTERGNILSHAAIVSRELKIPSVLGVENALQKIATGDLIEINGTDGEIKILKKYEKSI